MPETGSVSGSIGFAPANDTGEGNSINTPVPGPIERKYTSLQTEIQNGTYVTDGAPEAGCDDGDPCTIDSFDGNGCVYKLIDCDDGNVCTDDSCDNGDCRHTPKSCDDSNACTTDSCDPIAGCTTEPVVCDDGNACTTDSCDPVAGCSTEPVVCDDSNESTDDSCQGGECIYQPISSDKGDDDSQGGDYTTENLSNFSQNNSAVLSAAISPEHFDRHKCKDNKDCDDRNPCTVDACVDGNCTHTQKVCDDKNPSTNDYCYRGECYNTTLDCDVSDDCYIGSFNGKKCINISKCDDRNPCTEDKCDSLGVCHYLDKCDDKDPCTIDRCGRYGVCNHSPVNCDDRNPCTIDRCGRNGVCNHSPVVCINGKTCVEGVCQYPYYFYYPYYPYYLYYPYDLPYVSPPPNAAQPQSYTIPAGTSITLPWNRSVVAAEVLQVYNGLAYPRAAPISFDRVLGSPGQVASGSPIALSAINQAEMIGLSWKDAGFRMTLVQPDGMVLPTQGDGRNTVHLTDVNYDYYFLRSPMAGKWTVKIMPINPASGGTGYSLISGLVQGAIPANQA